MRRMFLEVEVEENLGFSEKHSKLGVFWVRRSNAPPRRSNAKARGKTWPLAIRTPLSGVRTPRQAFERQGQTKGAFERPCQAFERQGIFWPVLLFFAHFFLHALDSTYMDSFGVCVGH